MSESPRWLLLGPHYLNVPGTQWEYKETTASGEQARILIDVPKLLDPKEPRQWNDPEGIVVAHGVSPRHPKDIIFVGEPTPDMRPMNDEAEAISEALQSKWQHPIEALPGDFGQSLVEMFQKQIDALAANRPAPVVQNTSVAGVSPEDFAALQAQVAELMNRNAELEAAAPGRRA